MIPAVLAAEQLLGRGSDSRMFSSPTTTFTPQSGDFSIWGALPDDDGIYVNESSALTISAFWAGITLISEAMASMPLKVFRRRDDGGWDHADQHPVNYIFERTTNGWMTPSVWKSFEQAMCLMSGNAVSEIVRNGRGQAVKLNHWLSSSTMYGLDKKGDPAYGVVPGMSMIAAPVQTFDRQNYYAPRPEWFPYTEVLHLKGFSTNGMLGMKVLDAARMNLSTALIMERFQKKFFTKGRPVGFISKPGQVTPEQRDEIRLEWKELYEGINNALGVGVLSHNSQWVPMGYNNDDAQLLQNKAFSVLDVARWLRIPPHMLAELSKATEVNIEQLMLEFITFTLLPWIVRHEEEMNLKLFTPMEQFKYEVFFDVDAFLRGDQKTRATVAEQNIRNGITTIEQERLKLRLNPYEEMVNGQRIGSQPLIIASQLDTLSNVLKGTSLLHGQPKPAAPAAKA